MVVEQWPDDELASPEIDTKRANLIKSRRPQSRRRLVHPFEKDDFKPH